MFARLCWFHGTPDWVEDRIATARKVLPREGCVGLTIFVNRDGGDGVAMSYWHTTEALQASEATEGLLRHPPSQPDSPIDDIDQIEFFLQEGVVPPWTGTWLRLNDLRGSPARVDVLVDVFRERILPVAKAQPGFHALILGGNRQSGRILAFSIWDTAAAREASDPPFQAPRTEVRQLAGFEGVKVGLYESAITELNPPSRSLP